MERQMRYFYALVMLRNKTLAAKKYGCFDEHFNYYRSKTKDGTAWYAIDPDTGLSVARGATYEDVKAAANQEKRMQLFEETKKKPSYHEKCEQFAAAKTSAMSMREKIKAIK